MNEFVGLLPAAGRATRLGPIPCSKEIMPLGFQRESTSDAAPWQPVTAIETHLYALKMAGATRCAIVINETKADVVRYLASGGRHGLPLAYLCQQQDRGMPWGMPYALALATPWIAGATTLFSMPDTLITPADTIARLARYHVHNPADLTLGLFHTTTPQKYGMVALDAEGAVLDFIDKPEQTDLRLMWGLAAWAPRFSDFLHDFLTQLGQREMEVVLSDVFLEALHRGLKLQAFVLGDARYHDIGTPGDFQGVVFDLAGRQAAGLA